MGKEVFFSLIAIVCYFIIIQAVKIGSKDAIKEAIKELIEEGVLTKGNTEK